MLSNGLGMETLKVNHPSSELTERVDEASAISWLSSVTMDDKVQLAFGRLQPKSDSPLTMKRPFASEAISCPHAERRNSFPAAWCALLDFGIGKAILQNLRTKRMLEIPLFGIRNRFAAISLRGFSCDNLMQEGERGDVKGCVHVVMPSPTLTVLPIP